MIGSYSAYESPRHPVPICICCSSWSYIHAFDFSYPYPNLRFVLVEIQFASFCLMCSFWSFKILIWSSVSFIKSHIHHHLTGFVVLFLKMPTTQRLEWTSPFCLLILQLHTKPLIQPSSAVVQLAVCLFNGALVQCALLFFLPESYT